MNSRIEEEAARRRTIAVISHPDAGKSTLTESLLLHASAVAEAGAVHGKSTRTSTVSDWMDIEKTRGISISSAAIQFTVDDVVFNLVDTPGHADFSEDTYRVLAAVDAAIMLIDASKGMEAQTIRLFEVCARRDLPVIVMINKWDRPGRPALELLDELIALTGRQPMPVSWPVGDAGYFQGLLDVATRELLVFDPDGSGAHLPVVRRVPAHDVAGTGDAWQTAVEEAELVALDGGEYSQHSFLDLSGMPVFFGAAVRNIGVGELLRFIHDHAPSASPRASTDGHLRPVNGDFSAQVFKVQASMDPAHRDRVAFVRICSGQFTRGMVTSHAQSGRTFATKYALHMFGRERETVDTAWPGDIVGLVNATLLHPGDTLYANDQVEYVGMSSFTPELFALVSPDDTGSVKKFRKGLTQLAEEGVIQLLESERRGPQTPMVGAVGQMQFEVLTARMLTDFGVGIRVSHLPYTIACPTDSVTAASLHDRRDCEVVARRDDHLVLFIDEWRLRALQRERPDLNFETPRQRAGTYARSERRAS
ncbi:peptide chain release factor 3 [Microbacterium profundi]|uniref:peptide chain release factor 3 n=1 Tax=Microbacterium profundi TaxID=450380 RepID=UPI0027DF2D92|nr:peptide chain release factor 3 [Microbacterium profundi]MCE7483573.1 peptide chain release factor 3 [Microbacterium profundi]